MRRLFSIQIFDRSAATLGTRGFSHAQRDLYTPANDSRTGNDPQIGPQLIPGPEMILINDAAKN